MTNSKKRIKQPTGIRGFGWGVLGWFGAGLIISIVVNTCVLIAEHNGEMAWMWIGVVAGLGLAIWFARTRKYTATRTGAIINICLQLMGACVAISLL